MQLSEKQLVALKADGHLLVTGGPGSGKTTVSILKAAQIAERHLCPAQSVLFLSFARATVSRVVEAIEYEHAIPHAQKRRIEVETYHSFFWRILKAHGYLLAACTCFLLRRRRSPCQSSGHGSRSEISQTTRGRRGRRP
jgi:DNA helicase-2/ATP-dependent DNA helicase PcrA